MMAVTVALAIGLIMPPVISDHVSKGQSIVGREEVHASRAGPNTSEDPATRVASAPLPTSLSPRQNLLTSSRKRSFHSSQLGGNWPRR